MLNQNAMNIIGSLPYEREQEDEDKDKFGVHRPPDADTGGVETYMPTSPVSDTGDIPTETLRGVAGDPSSTTPQQDDTTSPRSGLEKAIARRQELQDMKPGDLDKKKDPMWLNVVKGILGGLPALGQALNSRNMSDKQALFQSLGHVIGSGLANAVVPHADEARQLEAQRNEAAREVGIQQGIMNQFQKMAESEQGIKESDAKIKQGDAKMQQETNRNKIREENNRINAIKALTGLAKAGDYKTAGEELAFVLGRDEPLELSDPGKEVKEVSRPERNDKNEVFVTYTFKDGTTEIVFPKDKRTGQVVISTDPRIQVANIQAEKSLTIEKGKREIDLEKIKVAREKISSDKQLGEWALVLKEQGQEDEVIDNISYFLTSEDFPKEERDRARESLRRKLNKETDPRKRAALLRQASIDLIKGYENSWGGLNDIGNN